MMKGLVSKIYTEMAENKVKTKRGRFKQIHNEEWLVFRAGCCMCTIWLLD